AQGVVLFISFPVSRDIARVADRKKMEVWSAAELIANLERGGLLSLDTNRIDAVDHLDFAGRTEFTHDAQCFVEVAFDCNRGRAVHEGLSEFAQSNLSLR